MLCWPAVVQAQQPMFSDDVSVIYADGTILGTGTSEWKFADSAFISFKRPGLNLQINAAENRISGAGISDLASLGGDLFWRGRRGTFGVTVSHASAGAVSVTSYGAFGEWYASDQFTLRGKGGGFHGGLLGFGSTDGGYAGAGAEVYLWRNLGISASYAYIGVSGGHIHDIEGSIAWQVSDTYPLAIWLGAESYNSGGGYARSFKAGLTYRFGVSGSLVGIDRLGAIKWNGGLPGL